MARKSQVKGWVWQRGRPRSAGTGCHLCLLEPDYPEMRSGRWMMMSVSLWVGVVGHIWDTNGLRCALYLFNLFNCWDVKA